ncbi:hypothetical protein F511_32767 [Dorcoceras hygrometricum]|uniref:Dystroglycan-like n=1 Tax=Dorcoceras hygrometricum TaxID=472368 RepID=A0A2Z7A9Y9_9LAMI|nr:hypothetical protein F511_32767 [Dorcoceras hygrometricum]
MDQPHDQIAPSVPAAGSVATNIQPDVAQAVASTSRPTTGVTAASMSSPTTAQPFASTSRPTTGVPAASTYFQMVSLPPAGQPDASTSYHPVVSHRFTQLQVMCSGGTVDNQSREEYCVGNIPVTVFLIHSPTTMASSLISSSHHIDFESVFGFDDAGMVQMFETLITTGLKNSLDCPAVFYEAALTELFTNGSVRDGLVVSTVNSVTVEISEKVFVETFELPIDGLTDLSDVPKNLVFDARSLFSASKEQVSISCFKKEMKIEYRLLHDILAKTLFVKAGSFDAVTRERFMLMTAITFDVKVNWSNLLFGVLKAMVTPGSRQAKGFAIQIGVILQKVPGLGLEDSRPFPASRVLTEKTVHRFVNINEEVGMENTAASPRVKKTPVKKAVSKKRQVGAGEEALVMTKKRTTKGKPAAIALEAVPLQIIETTAEMPAEQPSKPKRKTQKRKRRLVLDDADETGDSAPERPAAEIAAVAQVPIVDDPVATQPDIVPIVEATTDDPDAMIEKILNQLDTVAGTDGGDQPTAPAIESTPWFDLPLLLARREAEGLLSSDTDEDLEQIFMLHDKGKEILEEDEPVKGNPAREMVALICGDVDFLVQLRDKVMQDVIELFHSFSLNKLTNLDALLELKEKEKLMLEWAETDSLETAVKRKTWTTKASKIIDLLTVPHSKSLEALVAQQKEHGLPMEQPCTSTFLDTSIGSGAVLAQFFSQAKSTCWVRPMVLIDARGLTDIMATNLESVKKDVETSKEDISHQLLEFQAQAQANHNILHAQLSELVAYINRGGDNKKGESTAAEDLNLHHLPLIKSEALVLMLVHQNLRKELKWHKETLWRE